MAFSELLQTIKTIKAQRRAGKGKRGVILILFTLMLPTLLLPLAGLGVDATMCYIVQAKLGSAVDGAALGAGRLLGTQADPAEIAGEFLAANFRTDGTKGFWNANTMNKTITYTPGITKTISVDANVRVPLLFARIFGQPYAVVSAAGTAQRTDSRVVMVIDRSGSMNTSDGGSSTVIADVISYAAGFTQRFTEGTDELGLVVFDETGVVGYPTGTWSSTISSTSTGGPNTTFWDGTTNDMVHQINRITAGWGTGTADALSLAYIELQKAHMRDLQTGTDTRLNTIVLFTDGVPSAASLYVNNQSYSTLKSTSTCTNKSVNTPAMIGSISIGGSPPYSKTTSNLWGFYELASLDPSSTHTSVWWMSNPGSFSNGVEGGDAMDPNPTTPWASCTNLYGYNSNTPNIHSTNDLGQIPSTDYYGNTLVSQNFTNSSITGGATTSIYDGATAMGTTVTKDYNWGAAFWNAADSAAQRIRSDANLSNRAGDTQNMYIQIYTIGYTGNGGCDDGLLKRIANDKASSSYDATQPTGQYIQATNTTQLAQAFATVASEILRLSK